MADAEGELQGWWWGPGQRSLITIRAYLLWERRPLSWTQVLGSPGVKTMIAIMEVGSPLSQRGWRWSGGRRRKSPLWRRCSLGEEEADKDSEEGNNWAYFWPCGFKTVKEKRVVFFWISPPFLGFPISLPFKKCMLCPFQSLQREIVSSPRLPKNEAFGVATVPQSAVSATWG